MVIGATGGIGSAVVRQLMERGVSVRAMTRQPESATLPGGVEVVRGDLDDPASIDSAAEGADAVFLVWTTPAATVSDVVRRLAPQTSRIVFLSSPHQTKHPFFQQPNPMARFHADVERAIADSGVASTILRPGMLASNARFWWAPQIRAGDVVRWPFAASASAPIDERDIAAVAAHALLDEPRATTEHVLTGPESLTHADQVAIIADVIGRRLRYEELSPNEFRRLDGMPPAIAGMLLDAWAAGLGLPPYMTSSVAEITGRPARPFREWVVEHIDLFRSEEQRR
jgi:uncharacterized protein YbjT (DUF2867 family)